MEQSNAHHALLALGMPWRARQHHLIMGLVAACNLGLLLVFTSRCRETCRCLLLGAGRRQAIDYLTAAAGVRMCR
jgi:hypothetical protein